MIEVLVLSFAAPRSASPLRLEVASLGRILVQEVNRTLARAEAEARSADRVRALEEARGCVQLLRALRDQHGWLVLSRLEHVERDIRGLEARFLQRGDYDIAGRSPTDPCDAYALASLLAPLLAAAAGQPSPPHRAQARAVFRPRGDQFRRSR